MGVISNDLNEDTYIGLELPLTHTGDGFFKRTKTALEQAKSNIKTLLMLTVVERSKLFNRGKCKSVHTFLIIYGI